MKAEYILFPRRCTFCGSVVFGTEDVCKRCKRERKPLPTEDFCPHCGVKKTECHCGKFVRYYDDTVGAYYYDGPAKSLIRRYKFSKLPSLARKMAEEMYSAQLARKKDFSYDFITYVPQTFSEFSERSFDHTALPAKILSVMTGVKTEAVLKKVTETERQRSLGKIFRYGNVLGAFDVKPGFDLTGKKILIVDDVKTSGATVNECAKMLKINGADVVDILVFAVSGK